MLRPRPSTCQTTYRTYLTHPMPGALARWRKSTKRGETTMTRGASDPSGGSLNVLCFASEPGGQSRREQQIETFHHPPGPRRGGLTNEDRRVAAGLEIPFSTSLPT